MNTVGWVGSQKMDSTIVLPIAELARIARASSDTELAHKIAQLAELAQVFERW